MIDGISPLDESATHEISSRRDASTERGSTTMIATFCSGANPASASRRSTAV